MSDFVYEGFDELEAAGYISEMFSIEHFKDGRPSIMRPAFDLESCKSCGFGRGIKVRFTGRGGYDREREHAQNTLGDMILTVNVCRVDSWSSSYQFEEVSGSWNTVMFEEVNV